MSEINVNRSEVDEERYFAHLDQSKRIASTVVDDETGMVLL